MEVKSSAKHYSSKIFRAYILLLKRKAKEAEFISRISALGYSLNEFYDDRKWFSIVEERQIMSVIREIVGDKDVCFQAGKLGMKPGALGRAEVFMIKNVLSMFQIFKNVPTYANVLNRVLRYEQVAIGKNIFSFKVIPQTSLLSEYEKKLLLESIPDVVESTKGYWLELAKLKGFSSGKVEVVYEKENIFINVSLPSAFWVELFQNFKTCLILLLPGIIGACLSWLVSGSFNNALLMGMLLIISTVSILLFGMLNETKTIAKRVDEQIQESQLMQVQLKRQAEQNLLVRKFVERLIQDGEVESLYQNACVNLKEIIGFDRVLIMVEENGSLVAKSGIGLGVDQFIANKFSLPVQIDSDDKTKLTNIFKNRSEVLIPSVAEHLKTLKDSMSIEFLTKSASKSFACSAIASKSKAFGLLIADNVQENKVLEPQDLHLLATIAKQIGLFLETLETQKKIADTYKTTAEAYSKFVPWKALDFLGYNSIFQVKLGDYSELDVCVLFADIRDFTTLCEEMNPRDVIKFLNSYFHALSPIVEKYDGLIDKFMGDGVMIMFEDSQSAVRAAVEIQSALHEYNVLHRLPLRKTIKSGIGIHKGRIVLGPVGYEDRLNITLVSDSVNVASRLDSYSKEFDADILVSDEVVEMLEPASLTIINHGERNLKGKSKAIQMFEIIVPIQTSLETIALNRQSKKYIQDLKFRYESKISLSNSNMNNITVKRTGS
ncbi:MAG: adenylate/guanylate cyclase domain-containing protein [Bdellovibrionales bacterium]